MSRISSNQQVLLVASIDLALQWPACYFVWHPVLWLLLLLVACMDMNTYGRTHTRICTRTFTLAHAELEQALAQARAQHGKNKSKSNGNGMNGNVHGGGSRHRGADDGMEDIQVVFEEPFTSSGGKQFLIVLYILQV